MSERLTKRKDYGCACWNGDQNIVTHRRYMELLDALAKYEDVIFDADGNEIISLARLRKLAEAEREGRVVVLPDCKINDNVFVKVGNGSEVLEIAVDCFYVDELGAYIGHFDIDGQLMRWKDFTKC